MRIAPEGWAFILPAWVVAFLLVGTARTGLWLPAALWLPLAFWVVAFFRDPPRNRVRGDELILAPADGRIVSVIPQDEPEFLRSSSTRVSIFMNVFDVHVNRYPAGGRVAYRRYSRGRFLNAAAEKASTANEQAAIGLETRYGRLLVRQIAGLIARRIVTDHQEGREVRQAERLGLIRFGSRVDLFVPASARVVVSAGQRARAGETVVAQWT